MSYVSSGEVENCFTIPDSDDVCPRDDLEPVELKRAAPSSDLRQTNAPKDDDDVEDVIPPGELQNHGKVGLLAGTLDGFLVLLTNKLSWAIKLRFMFLDASVRNASL